MAAAGNSSFVGSLYMTMGLNSSSFVSGFVAAKAIAKQGTAEIASDISKMNTATRGASHGMAMLGQQVSDIGVQATMGTNPFMIFAQQVPQVTYALSTMNGTLGRVGAALSGPFGAAMIAAIGFVGMFASKAMEAGKNAKEAADGGVKSLADRMKELAGLSGPSFGMRATALGGEYAEQSEKDAKKIKELTEMMVRYQRMAVRLEAMPVGTQEEMQQRQAQIDGLNVKMEKTRREIEELSKTANENRNAFQGMTVAMSDRRVDAALDKAKAINQAYDEEIGRIVQLRQQNRLTASEYEEQRIAAIKSRDAQLQALEDEKKAAEDAVRRSEEYAESLKSVTDQALPSVAAMREYNDQLKLFQAAAAGGLVSAENFSVGLVHLRDAMLSAVAGPEVKASLESWKNGDALKITTDKSFSEAYARQMEVVKEKNKEAAQSASMFAATLSSSFSDALFSGKSLGSVFKGLYNDIGQLAIKMVVLEPIARSLASALSGGGGLFGKVFGGGRASGGPVQAGVSYMVGERGAEMFTPGVSGRITPASAMAAQPQSVGVQVNINPSPYFDVQVQKTAAPMVVSGAVGATSTAMVETQRRQRTAARLSLTGA